MSELKIQRMMGCDAVKCIKFGHLVGLDNIFHKRLYIVGKFPEINIIPLHNSVK